MAEPQRFETALRWVLRWVFVPGRFLQGCHLGDTEESSCTGQSNVQQFFACPRIFDIDYIARTMTWFFYCSMSGIWCHTTLTRWVCTSLHMLVFLAAQRLLLGSVLQGAIVAGFHEVWLESGIDVGRCWTGLMDEIFSVKQCEVRYVSWCFNTFFIFFSETVTNNAPNHHPKSRLVESKVCPMDELWFSWSVRGLPRSSMVQSS